MDLIAAKLGAKMAMNALEADGRIGVDKVDKTYTFDGIVGDKPNSNGLVFISPDMPDINSIESVTAIFGGELVTVTKNELRIEDQSDPTSYMAYYGNYPLVGVVLDDMSAFGIPAGLWVLNGGAQGYVTSVTFDGGEVKPINPKYLPGLTLPVVELSEATAMALMGTGSATLTAEEAAAFDEMAANCAPFVITAKMQGVVMAACMLQYGNNMANEFYSGALHGLYIGADDSVINGIALQAFYFKKTSDGWSAVFVQGNINRA